MSHKKSCRMFETSLSGVRQIPTKHEHRRHETTQQLVLRAEKISAPTGDQPQRKRAFHKRLTILGRLDLRHSGQGVQYVF